MEQHKFSLACRRRAKKLGVQDGEAVAPTTSYFKGTTTQQRKAMQARQAQLLTNEQQSSQRQQQQPDDVPVHYCASLYSHPIPASTWTTSSASIPALPKEEEEDNSLTSEKQAETDAFVRNYLSTNIIIPSHYPGALMSSIASTSTPSLTATTTTSTSILNTSHYISTLTASNTSSASASPASSVTHASVPIISTTVPNTSITPQQQQQGEMDLLPSLGTDIDPSLMTSISDDILAMADQYFAQYFSPATTIVPSSAAATAASSSSSSLHQHHQQIFSDLSTADLLATPSSGSSTAAAASLQDQMQTYLNYSPEQLVPSPPQQRKRTRGDEHLHQQDGMAFRFDKLPRLS